MTRDESEFEYDQVMRSYHEYFQLVAKGITIYLVIIGACLTLPNTVRFDAADRLTACREACRVFAVVISVAAIGTYAMASVGFWLLHRRAVQLAIALRLAFPTTWILPIAVWLACIAATLLVVFVGQYS